MLLLIVSRGDLAAVTILAVGEFSQCAQDTMRWPVGQIGLERNFLAHRPPRFVAAQLDEPKVLRADEIERQEPHRAILEFLEERLGAAAPHVATTHDGIHFDLPARQPGLFNDEQEVSAGVRGGDDDGVLEAQRPAVELRDDLRLMG
jgi:hypothetical protein